MNKPTLLAASLLTLAALAACGESGDMSTQTETAATDAATMDAASTDLVVVGADADAAAAEVRAAARADEAAPAPVPAPIPAEPSASSPEAAGNASTIDPSCPPEHAELGHCTPKSATPPED